MASAEMQAGSAGHAFLAEWYTSRDLRAALAAFDASLSTLPRAARPGWYSDSALGLLHECPTKFYLSKIHGGRGLERVYPPTADETAAKQGELLAQRLAQAKDACKWLAESEERDGSATQDTWATEMYLETPAPFRFRMWVDHLVWLRDLDALAVRDHKFTWKADLRVGARILYGDQLLLYAATWNRRRSAWGRDLPRVDFIMPNVIAVSARGEHKVMPAEPKYLTPQREEEFWVRLWRTQEMADAFTTQAQSNGFPYARQFMQPRSCWVFSPCGFIPACHEDVPLDDPTVYQPSTRATTEDDE